MPKLIFVTLAWQTMKTTGWRIKIGNFSDNFQATFFRRFAFVTGWPIAANLFDLHSTRLLREVMLDAIAVQA